MLADTERFFAELEEEEQRLSQTDVSKKMKELTVSEIRKYYQAEICPSQLIYFMIKYVRQVYP